MNLRKLMLGLAFAFAIALVSVPALAETFGASGEVEDVNVSSRTFVVGAYELVVTSSSVMQDESGRTISISDLNSINGSVSFTMRKSGTRWELISLVVVDDEDLDEDEQEEE